MSQRGENRDYIPTRERGAESRMKANSSLEDGLSGRIEAEHRGARFRKYRKDGQPQPEKKWEGMTSFMDD